MMALHGCGQRAMIGEGRTATQGARALAWAGALALSVGLGGGSAGACHIKPKDQAKAASTPAKAPAAEILTPTSLVNAPPVVAATPTPTTAPLPTAIPATPSALIPSPLVNPPAADQILAAPPAVANHSSGAAPTCSCTCPPVNPPPISNDTSPPKPLNPGSTPPTNSTPNAPEPSTIVSALAMISLAVVARRRQRAGA